MRDGALAQAGGALVEAQYVWIAPPAQARVVIGIQPCAGADLDDTGADIIG